MCPDFSSLYKYFAFAEDPRACMVAARADRLALWRYQTLAVAGAYRKGLVMPSCPITRPKRKRAKRTNI
jgi:hypothetical protein